MKIKPIILLVSTLACIELAASQDESAIGPALMKGKVKTDHTVKLRYDCRCFASGRLPALDIS